MRYAVLRQRKVLPARCCSGPPQRQVTSLHASYGCCASVCGCCASVYGCCASVYGCCASVYECCAAIYGGDLLPTCYLHSIHRSPDPICLAPPALSPYTSPILSMLLIDAAPLFMDAVPLFMDAVSLFMDAVPLFMDAVPLFMDAVLQIIKASSSVCAEGRAMRLFPEAVPLFMDAMPPLMDANTNVRMGAEQWPTASQPLLPSA
eukprot:3613427-Rhodomonas_salina.3